MERFLRIDTLDDFLCGENRADGFCRPEFTSYIDDILLDINDYDVDDVVPVPEHPGFWMVGNGWNVLLLTSPTVDADAVVGFYNGPTVCLRQDMRGHGLGAELILYTAIQREGPPTQEYSKQMFSLAGLCAHIRAYYIGVKRGMIIPLEQPENGIMPQ